MAQEAPVSAAFSDSLILENVIENSSDLIAAQNLDFRYVALNTAYRDAFRRVFGVDIQVGESMLEALAHLPEEREAAAEMWSRSHRGDVVHETMEAGDPNLGRRQFEMLIRPVRNGGGEIIGAIEIAADVTDQRLAEQALRDATERQRIVLETAMLGTWKHDITKGILEFDEIARGYYGFDQPTIRWEEFLERLHPDDRRRIEQEAESFYEPTAPEKLKSTEYRVLHPDGSTRWILTRLRVQYEDAGEGRMATIAYGTDLDITERKQAEERVRLSEEKYRALFDQAVNGVFLHELDGQILDVNQLACQQSGYSRNELLDMNVFDLLEGAEESNPLREEILRQWQQWREGERVTIEARHRRKDGSVIPVQIATGLVCFGGRNLILAIVQDITERKLAEEALQRSEAFLNSVIESMPIAVFLSDPHGKLTRANEQGRALWGVPLPTTEAPEDYVRYEGRFVETGRAVGPDEWTMLRALRERRPITNGLIEISLFGNGGKRTILSHAAPVMADDGTILGGVLAVVDVTALRKTQEELQRHRDKLEHMVEERTHELLREREILRAVIDNIPVMLTMYDGNGNILIWNRELEHMSGWTAAEVARMDVMAAMYPDTEYRKSVWDFMMDAGPDWRDLTITMRNGSTIESSWTNVLRSDGSRIGIGIDISRRKADEREIRRARLEAESHAAQLDAILANMRDGLVVVDASGTIVTMNRSFMNMLGFSQEEAPEDVDDLPKLLYQVVGDHELPAKEWSFFRALYGNAGMMEARLTRRDGKASFLGRFSYSPVKDAAGNVTMSVTVVSDITYEMELEEQQDSLRQQLVESQKLEAIGQLAGGVAHDFNNMMAVVIGWTSRLLSKTREYDPLRHGLEAIKQSGERAAALTRHLLAFSRKQIMKPEVVDLRDVVTDMASMLPRLLTEEIVLEVKTGEMPVPILVDRNQIEQAVLNIALNARDAMPRGGRLDLIVERVENDGQPCGVGLDCPCGILILNDTGCGMNKETLSRIFEPFFTTKPVGKGTGLGLSTVHGIVKQSGGDVTVESEPDRGTSFRLCFPIHDVQAPEQPVIEEEAVARRLPARILVVEDERAVRELAALTLSDAGYEVLEADGLEEAIRLANEHAPVDLLLTDVILPGGDGLAVADRIGKLHPGIKRVFMSGFTQDLVRERTEERADEAFIMKPFTERELLQIVGEMLRQED